MTFEGRAILLYLLGVNGERVSSGEEKRHRVVCPSCPSPGVREMPDLYRAVPCIGCGKTHDLYDTSAVRHAPGELLVHLPHHAA